MYGNAPLPEDAAVPCGFLGCESIHRFLDNAINFVAACQICNAVKGSSIFATVEEARTNIVSLSEVQELTETPSSGEATE